MFSELLAFKELVSSLYNWLRGRGASSEKGANGETIGERFIRLFKSHGVHHNQIPKFFGHNISLADLQDNDRLLDKLTDKTLQDAADLFSVRREWLDGASDKVYKAHYCYKMPERFVNLINTLKQRSEIIHGRFFIAPESKGWQSCQLVIEECVGNIGDKQVFRYHFLDDEMDFHYWRCRCYFVFFIAYAREQGVYINASLITKRDFVQFFEDHRNIPKLDEHSGGMSSMGQRIDVEQLIYDTDYLTEGLRGLAIDKTLALNLWDELTDSYLKENIRPLTID
ncbi:hypothetical protein EDC56_2840 [Sinobacterium caligoides]|uniref:Uncharacterized protein n=1 Tax=Sinobacterium caligoides TaxID=933926 RepID=A0A3N2DKH4_9GAMM|nr:hypothetical protein [Sinobacterium caligoides]ROS00202.1 hypothetical protein EDC56_2840 [Sinobacterium caligoides]